MDSWAILLDFALEEEEEVEEEVVEAEGEPSWHQLLLTVVYKVHLCMLVYLVEFCLIRVLHTRL